MKGREGLKPLGTGRGRGRGWGGEEQVLTALIPPHLRKEESDRGDDGSEEQVPLDASPVPGAPAATCAAEHRTILVQPLRLEECL